MAVRKVGKRIGIVERMGERGSEGGKKWGGEVEKGGERRKSAGL